MVIKQRLRLIGWVAAAAAGAVFAQRPATDETESIRIFAQRCSSCHGSDAAGTDRAPPLAGSRRLRTRSEQELHDTIQKGTAGGMPAFALPESELRALAVYVRLMNASAFDLHPPGNRAAGEVFFFGKGRCATCHT